MNLKILTMLSALATIGFVGSLVFANAELEPFNECLKSESPNQIDWSVTIYEWNCIAYNPQGISVMQHNLDKTDVDTLWNIAKAKVDGTYIEPLRIDWKFGAMDTTIKVEPIPFQDIRHPTQEQFNTEENKARNFQCIYNFYPENYKRDIGCVKDKDGNWMIQ